MLAPLLTLTIEAFLLLGFMVCVDRCALGRNLHFVFLFFSVFYIDNLLIISTSLFPQLRLIPNHVWGGFLIADWSGKLYSILVISSLICLCKTWLPPVNIGLTIRQQPGSWLPSLVITTLLGFGFGLSGLPFPRGPLDIQMLAYMAVMPGVNEELVYRGVMLAAANRLFAPRWTVFGAQLGWGTVLTTLIFALLHGFWLDSGLQPHFLAGRVLMSLFNGAVFVWLRERTGSLLFPILAHGAVDFCAYFGRMI